MGEVLTGTQASAAKTKMTIRVKILKNLLRAMFAERKVRVFHA